jgi:hypothetical protein
MKITFTPSHTVLKDYYPIPAKKNIPEWYKNLESYISGKKIPNGRGGITSTIKRCMPVFDIMTAGYLIPLHTDLFVSQKFDENTGGIVPYYEWAGYSALEFHPLVQAPTHPDKNGFTYPKLVNLWGIKTPPGYSVLITTPTHRDCAFSILPAIVDTDEYNAPIHFPFVLKDKTFEGLIPAGTPFAQIIPFKRDSWEMEIGKEEEEKKLRQDHLRITTHFWDTYKNVFRQKKEFN